MLYLLFSMTIHYYCYIIIEIFITQYIMRFFAFHLPILSKAKNPCFISCINYKYCFKIIIYFIFQMLYLWFSMTCYLLISTTCTGTLPTRIFLRDKNAGVSSVTSTSLRPFSVSDKFNFLISSII